MTSRSPVDLFTETVAVLKELQYTDLLNQLETAWQPVTDDLFRVAVAGEFKTGKSTLINRTFLRQPLLHTDLMEATAVPTEIRYGSAPKLVVYPYRGAAYPGPAQSEGAPPSPSAALEDAPVVIDHPTPADIREHTAADAPEARARLARTTARVTLFWPAPELKGMVLFDTPGINTLNPAVVATTYRIIPESDLVVFLSRQRQLNAVELDFLSNRVFARGITRCMLVISAGPEDGDPPADQKAALFKAIRHQLANIGRPHIELEMIDLHEKTLPASAAPHAPPARTPSRDSSREAVSAVIADLLRPAGTAGGTSPSDGPAPRNGSLKGTASAMERFQDRLIAFIRDNAARSRHQKAAHLVSEAVHHAQIRLSAALAASTQDISTREEMIRAVKQRESDLKSGHREVVRRLEAEMDATRRQLKQELDSGLRRMADARITRIAACPDLAALQSHIKQMQRSLPQEVETLLSRHVEDARERIQKAVTTTGMESRDLVLSWERNLPEAIRIQGGVLSRVPPAALMAADLLLFVRFGPFGPAADALIRVMVHFIPYVNRILLASVAAHILKRRIQSELTHQFESLNDGLARQIDAAFAHAAETLVSRWQTQIDRELRAVTAGLRDLLQERAAPDAGRLTGCREKLAHLQYRLDSLTADRADLFS